MTQKTSNTPGTRLTPTASTMGFDCGFDIYPCLDPETEDKDRYGGFLAEIIETYEDAEDPNSRRPDLRLLETPEWASCRDKLNITFMIGECPSMPYNREHCNYFLRFSSKVSGGIESYVRDVCKTARKHFGRDRVHFWHEMCETEDERQWGYYGWREVNEARQLEELGGQGDQDTLEESLDLSQESPLSTASAT